MSIQELEPRAVWQYFHHIMQIPRPSHQEEKIQQYILDEAARLGLAAERDARGNIRVRKAASAGRENDPGVILQAHLDMVAQKNQDTVHDFSKDPIRTVVKGDWVHADGTTLGADNGIGVAMILAVLAAPNLSHPPLEGLFTASEEVGLEGALAVQPGWLQGDILLNLDYEDEGELCIGCAGAVNGDYILPLQYWLIYQGSSVLFTTFIPVYAFLFMPIAASLSGDSRYFLARAATAQWAVMIAVYCISHIPALLNLHIPGYPHNILLPLFLVAVVQAGDVLQYIWGKLFGRKKIMPTLSPSKTVIGTVGGVCSAALLGGALSAITPFTAAEAVAIAFIVNVMGFFGGLVMSAIKRDRGVKDWGHLIEGHGGMLDRMDSLCFAAPVFFHCVQYFWAVP